MEVKTALELWNDGVEGCLNLQLYRCDVDSLLQEGLETSPLNLFEPDSPSYEELCGDVLQEGRMTSPVLDLDSTNEEVVFEGFALEGRVTPPLRLFDHLDSPTYEELFEQNWQLFEGLDEELQSSCAHKDVPEDLGSLNSPKEICFTMPEPTCLTKVIQAMVMYPTSNKKMPNKRRKKKFGRQKKRRPPRNTAIMVSDDENEDEVEPKVEDPPDGTVSRKSFQESCHPEQLLAESSSPVHRRIRKQDTPWNLRFKLGTPTSPRVLPAAPVAASDVVPSFAEHLARCAIDWDYPSVLFSMGSYKREPVSQKVMTLQTGETFEWPGPGPGPESSSTAPAQPLTPLASEQKSAPTFGTSNGVSRKKRYASSTLFADSERLHGPRMSANRNVWLENVEPIKKPALRQNKRRRLVT